MIRFNTDRPRSWHMHNRNMKQKKGALQDSTITFGMSSYQWKCLIPFVRSTGNLIKCAVLVSSQIKISSFPQTRSQCLPKFLMAQLHKCTKSQFEVGSYFKRTRSKYRLEIDQTFKMNSQDIKAPIMGDQRFSQHCNLLKLKSFFFFASSHQKFDNKRHIFSNSKLDDQIWQSLKMALVKTSSPHWLATLNSLSRTNIYEAAVLQIHTHYTTSKYIISSTYNSIICVWGYAALHFIAEYAILKTIH